MKKVVASLSFFTILSIGVAFSQYHHENDILRCTDKKRGVYRNFEEFRTNSPTYTDSFEIKKHLVMVYNKGKEKYEPYRGEYWGACKNGRVYVKRQLKRQRRFPDLKVIKFFGRYCYYTDHIEKNYYNPITGMSSELGLQVVGMDINNGRFFKVDETAMEQILKEDPDLFGDYEKKTDKEFFFIEYLEAYSEKHKDEITPVEVLIDK